MTARSLLVSLALGACGQSTSRPDAGMVDAVPRETITDTQTLQPGMLLEGTWLAGASDEIGITLTTTAADMDWDIHAHANGGTQDVVSAFGQMTVSYDFRPDQQAQWFMLIRNSAATPLAIEVRMELFGAAQWQGWLVP